MKGEDILHHNRDQGCDRSMQDRKFFVQGRNPTLLTPCQFRKPGIGQLGVFG